MLGRKSKTYKEWVDHILSTSKKNSEGCLTYSKTIRIRGKNISTNRFIYEHVIGPIPGDKVVSRICNNPRCCNPDHLRLGNTNKGNGKIDNKIILEIHKLRSNGESIKQISRTLGISAASASKYASDIILTDELLKNIIKKGRSRATITIRENKIAKWDNKYHFKELIKSKSYSKSTKGSIAEAAIIYRLLIHDFTVYSSIFSGSVIDIVALNNDNGEFLKIQVKCTRCTKSAYTPSISTRHMIGHNTFSNYTNKELDYLIGYDILNDVAYVFSWEDIKDNKNMISVTEDSTENWYKLRKK